MMEILPMGVELTDENYRWAVHLLKPLWLTRPRSEIIGHYIVLNDRGVRISKKGRQTLEVGTSLYTPADFSSRYEFMHPDRNRNVPQALRLIG
jgi:hypothetical protein